MKSNRDYATENMNLQKENAELKDQVAYFKEEFKGWQSAYEWSQSKNAILKLENEELKKELEFEKFDNFIVLGEKIDKYKKAIEILENKRVDVNKLLLSCCVEGYNDTVFTYKRELTKEEYDLLKEVLENENKI